MVALFTLFKAENHKVYYWAVAKQEDTILFLYKNHNSECLCFIHYFTSLRCINRHPKQFEGTNKRFDRYPWFNESSKNSSLFAPYIQ